MRCRQSLAKSKQPLKSQDMGATGGGENIAEGLSDLSLVSCFKVFMKNFHPIQFMKVETVNTFSKFSVSRSYLGVKPRRKKGVSTITFVRMVKIKRRYCRWPKIRENHTWHKNWNGVPCQYSQSHPRYSQTVKVLN